MAVIVVVRRMSTTMSCVRSRVVPPAPYVTDTYEGARDSSSTSVVRSVCSISGVRGGKNSKEKLRPRCKISLILAIGVRAYRARATLAHPITGGGVERVPNIVNFRIEQRITAPLEAVENALLDREFIAATAKLPKLGEPEVLEQQRDGDRVHQRVRYRFTAELSSAVTRVIDPTKLTWVDDARYDLTTHTSRHRILPDNYADRLEASYDVTLEPLGDSTRRVAQGELKVRIPLVGGRVERAIASGLEEHAAAEADLLGTWVTERA
jgi:hypothetical protein